jgi:nuclear migration protein JNM1
MAEPPARLQLAQLPGYDTAPDIYETPDVNDDSTASTAGARSSSHIPSEASDTSADDEDDDDDDDDDEHDDGHPRVGVSRRRLYPERARSRFGEQARGVETRGADLSDRVDGRRQGYRVKRGGAIVDEDESLEARIARLRREIEECRAEAKAERVARGNDGDEDDDGDDDDDDDDDNDNDHDDKLDATQKLCDLLADVNLPAKANRRGGRGGGGGGGGGVGGGAGHHARTASGSVFHDAPTTAIPETGGSDAPPPPPPPPPAEHTLASLTAFDTRLATLETALGLSALDAHPSDAAAAATTTPLLPTLTLLDHQLAALTAASSLASLEAAASKIQKLKADAHKLARLQRAATGSDPTPTGSDSGRDGDDDNDDDNDNDDHGSAASPSSSAPLLSTHDMKRLETLYALLPNLQALAPTVPALVTRLRSLRTLHTQAARAGRDLDEIEERQGEMERELKMWREGLERVEAAVVQHGEANGRNGNFVKGWVEELEVRVKALGR